MAKKTVFITGGTGNMGWAAVQEMLKHPNEINIKMLARKSPKNEEKLKDLMAKPNLKVVWGDLNDYDSILEGVTGADYVLHVGGMVSPTADWKPYKTQKTNIGAAQSICKAVSRIRMILKFAISVLLLKQATVTTLSIGADAATLSKFLFMTIMLFQRLLLNAHSLKAELRIGL